MATENEQAEAALASMLAAETAAASAETSVNLDDLLAEARQKLGVLANPTKDDEVEFEVADPNIVNALLAKASEYKRISDVATKEREKITALLASLTPNAGTLVVHGAPVFKVSQITSRIFKADHMKALFPDIPENAEFWEDRISTRRDYK